MWSTSDLPAEPLEIADWKDRNVGPVERIRFRLGKKDTFSNFNFPCAPTERPPIEASGKLHDHTGNLPVHRQ